MLVKRTRKGDQRGIHLWELCVLFRRLRIRIRLLRNNVIIRVRVLFFRLVNGRNHLVINRVVVGLCLRVNDSTRRGFWL